jgi:hypothetical protein
MFLPLSKPIYLPSGNPMLRYDPWFSGKGNRNVCQQIEVAYSEPKAWWLDEVLTNLFLPLIQLHYHQRRRRRPHSIKAMVMAAINPDNANVDAQPSRVRRPATMTHAKMGTHAMHSQHNNEPAALVWNASTKLPSMVCAHEVVIPQPGHLTPENASIVQAGRPSC